MPISNNQYERPSTIGDNLEASDNLSEEDQPGAAGLGIESRPAVSTSQVTNARTVPLSQF